MEGQMTLVIGILGAIGTMLLGLISAGIIALVKATINNTSELKVLSKTIHELAQMPPRVEKLSKDVDEIWAWKRKTETK